MVTTDSPQAISGRKTFDMPPIIRNNNDQTTTVPASQIQTQPYQLVGRDGEQIFFEQVITDTSGNRQHTHNIYGTDGVLHQFQIQTFPDGSSKYQIPTPKINGLNDNTLPTLDYLNNPELSTYLVHRSGSESLTGEKIFEALPMIDVTKGDSLYRCKSATAWNVNPPSIERHGIKVVAPDGLGFLARLMIIRNTDGSYEARFDAQVNVNGVATYKSIILGRLTP